MKDMLWVVFSYMIGTSLRMKNHKILYPSPICDQTDVRQIEEMLSLMFSAHDVTLLGWRRFEEP